MSRIVALLANDETANTVIEDLSELEDNDLDLEAGSSGSGYRTAHTGHAGNGRVGLAYADWLRDGK